MDYVCEDGTEISVNKEVKKSEVRSQLKSEEEKCVKNRRFMPLSEGELFDDLIVGAISFKQTRKCDQMVNLFCLEENFIWDESKGEYVRSIKNDFGDRISLKATPHNFLGFGFVADIMQKCVNKGDRVCVKFRIRSFADGKKYNQILGFEVIKRSRQA
jgi:hypothetical protein